MWWPGSGFRPGSSIGAALASAARFVAGAGKDVDCSEVTECKAGEKDCLEGDGKTCAAVDDDTGKCAEGQMKCTKFADGTGALPTPATSWPPRARPGGGRLVLLIAGAAAAAAAAAR